jgi:glycosyltransferase involved in cell wall biosynthesis
MSKIRTYLFIHQNMPGQFLHIARHLRDEGQRVVFITKNKVNAMHNTGKIVYDLHRPLTKDIHHYLKGTEEGILHGQAVYRAIQTVLQQGWQPDVVVGHCGWGETLFVKDALPKVPLINYFEFYYRPHGQDVGFDPEYPSGLDTLLSAKVKNNINYMCLHSCDWGLTPTRWQQSTYPTIHHAKMSVIHEGVDTRAIAPDPNATLMTPSGRELRAGQKIITYVARNMEPYRGFHIFMRALPEIHRRHPDADIIMIGGDGVSYGKHLPEGDTYKKRMLAEVQIDPDKVHWMDYLQTDEFVRALQVSAAHIYLTYPFVLSWSVLEAMSAGCLLVGSRTPPVEEVIRHEKNGLLVDFFDVQGLADTIDQVLRAPAAFAHLRQAARETMLAYYDVKTVTLPRQLALINSFAG